MRPKKCSVSFQSPAVEEVSGWRADRTDKEERGAGACHCPITFKGEATTEMKQQFKGRQRVRSLLEGKQEQILEQWFSVSPVR